MDNTKWMQSYVRKTSFFCTNALESCVPAHENTYLNSRILHHFLFFIRPFLKKWIILIYHSPVRFFLKAGKSQTTVFWVWPSSQLPGRGPFFFFSILKSKTSGAGGGVFLDEQNVCYL